MSTTRTNYYDIEKPELEASGDDWGRILNEGLDKLDFAVRNCLHMDTHAAFDTPLTANLCKLPIYVEPIQPITSVTHSQLLATQGWVEGRILHYMNRFMPVGTIMMWWGQLGNPATFPPGWSFCDGTAGSPNLQGRFILCAGSFPGGGIGAQTYGGTPSNYPGEHRHTHTANFYNGPAQATTIPIKDGVAYFASTPEAPVYSLPYCALAYIYKHALW